MELHLLQCSVVIFLLIVTSYGEVDPRVYFRYMLPNTPIPKAIKDSLPNDICVDRNHKGSISYVVGDPNEHIPGYKYSDAASDEQILGTKMAALFFLEKDMRIGKSFNLHISKDTTSTPPFVPRQVANSLPIASNKLQDIYKEFKVNPSSVEADLIKTTVHDCEMASNQEEDKYCTTSLESMVDFATLKLGKKIKVVSTQVDGKENAPLQGYKVKGVKKMASDASVVACHEEYYGYAVHYCHKASKINAYMVSLVGENNVKANAITICHEDTASWNPKHIAFQVLNVKPGIDSVCHFLIENEVAWFPDS